jgi:uncharacterized membrane protein
MTTITRTRDTLYLINLILVVIGLVISSYLSYIKLTNTAIICLEGDTVNCDIVQNSIYSKLAGIDIAYLGLLAYLGLGALLILEKRVTFLQDYGRTLMFGATLFAFIYAIWLVYVQAAILAAFCTWCLAHEATITALFVVSGLRLWQELKR